MQNTNFIRNILDFNKAGFDNAYNSLVTIHKKSEEVFEKNISSIPYIPDEGKKMMKSWFKMISETRDTMKEAVSTGHEHFESIFKSVAETASEKK